MSEYNISYRSYIHDFTPSQIRKMIGSIQRRKANNLKELTTIFHTANPSELIDSIDSSVAPKRSTKITDEIISKFNIKVNK